MTRLMTAFVHLERGNPEGAPVKFRKARKQLSPLPAHYLSVDVAQIVERIERLALHHREGDPEAFKGRLGGAMRESLTPWALGIERLPTVPRRRLWEIENEVKLLLADLAPLSPIFRDRHLLLLADKTGLPLATLVAACQEVADPILEDGAATTALAASSA